MRFLSFTSSFTFYGKYNTFRSSNRQTAQRKHKENHPWRENGQALQGLQHLESVYKHDVLQILRMWLSTRQLKREQLLLGHRRQQPAIRRSQLSDRPPVQRLPLGRILIHSCYFVNLITDKYPSATSRHCKWGCVKCGLRPKLFLSSFRERASLWIYLPCFLMRSFPLPIL